MDKNNDELNITIIVENIKQNLLEHPNKRCWFGIVTYNSHDYYWEVTKKDFPTLMYKN